MNELKDIPRPTGLVNRRNALAVAASLGVTFCELPSFLNAKDSINQEDSLGGFPLGVQSYSLRNFDLNEAVRHINGLGLHFVEFYSKHMDPAASLEEINAVKALARHQQLRLLSNLSEKISEGLLPPTAIATVRVATATAIATVRVGVCPNG